jgi:hypothetical protein
MVVVVLAPSVKDHPRAPTRNATRHAHGVRRTASPSDVAGGGCSAAVTGRSTIV